ncbi:hypothetical protein CMO86_04395 [Candidatus Woesearchaeota archaeon]|jgi:hypothetical protein|nr:hypothetical protein [Candidatus Woesearchaeota archaeon]|tara:strand:- start:685 stop:894 length:210 start_codon:yes stop_codon:yes gene_type:complete
MSGDYNTHNDQQPNLTYFTTQIMKCKVQLFIAGTVFDEIVVARDYDHARKIALARNPEATVMGVTAVFD